jgi:hypothetical protein
VRRDDRDVERGARIALVLDLIGGEEGHCQRVVGLFLVDGPDVRQRRRHARRAQDDEFDGAGRRDPAGKRDRHGRHSREPIHRFLPPNADSMGLQVMAMRRGNSGGVHGQERRAGGKAGQGGGTAR